MRNGSLPGQMNASPPPAATILVCAGEVSGDEHAARVVRAARRQRPDLRFVGVAGPEMIAAGVEPLFRAEELAVVGFLEVVRHLPRLRRVMRRLGDELESGRIDLCLTVDYPGFNLRLARRARAAGVPTMHYIAPTVWAWGRGRIRSFAQAVDRLALIFDFEEPLWREAGVDAHWVGHPLLDEERTTISRAEFVRLCAASGDEILVGLLPGSRSQEIRRLLPPMLSAAALMAGEDPRLRFVLPRAPGLDPSGIASMVAACPAGVTVLAGQAQAVLAHCAGAVVASGTATLQATLAGIPHILVYRLAPLTWALGRILVGLDHVGLANIIAGRTVTPELLQRDATPARIALELRRLLYEDTQRARMHHNLESVRAQLGTPGAAERTAALLIALLRQSWQHHDG